ncbi:MAG: hypothetical protein ACPG6V_01035 [Flavobacteriales bacterium]
MKRFIITIIVSVLSISSLLAQPMPNQNPYNSPEAATSGPTQNSITTLSVEHNELIMLAVCLMAVAAIYYVAKQKRANA